MGEPLWLSGWMQVITVCTLKKKKRERERKKWKKKKIIPLRQNLLRSVRPFPEPIQLLVLGASLFYGKPLKKGAYQLEERL